MLPVLLSISSSRTTIKKAGQPRLKNSIYIPEAHRPSPMCVTSFPNPPPMNPTYKRLTKYTRKR